MIPDPSITASQHPTVVFEPLYPDVHPPARATEHAAGYDLTAYLAGRSVRICGADGEMCERAAGKGGLVLHAAEVALVPLGFKARLPAGCEAQIRIRSSWAFKYGLTLPNAPGTIDADYPDEWMVMMRAGREATVRHGDRIAQAVIARYVVAAWREGAVGYSTDRTGGFGSTG